MDAELSQMLLEARELSWTHHGRALAVHLPGMFVAYGRRGRYPAVSITGQRCEQGCDHCRGRLLESMLAAITPPELLALGRRLAAAGQEGLLLSGGSDPSGRLPWEAMLPAIEQLSAETDLIITAHVGRIDEGLARALKAAGVRQALVDVVGSPETARQVLHLADGLAAQEETLAACAAAGLEVVPHIILGLHAGRLGGEAQALELVAAAQPQRVVFVVLMPLAGTPLAQAQPPSPADVARFLAQARLRLPEARHHLGCARPRGRARQELDALAVYAGVNALAIPSDGALSAARELGLTVTFADTCCSVSLSPEESHALGRPARAFE
ncbi:MAG: radical SAM protein [Desulfarculus sp.]|nr:MAG: radical SAM protein [Desulfarculus sp.]